MFVVIKCSLITEFVITKVHCIEKIGDVNFEWEYFEKFNFENFRGNGNFESSKYSNFEENNGNFEFNFENNKINIIYGCLHYGCWELIFHYIFGEA